MYCRKCGAKLPSKSKFCPDCGEDVIYIEAQSYSQLYANAKQRATGKKDTRRAKKLAELKNPYVVPALGSSIVAFIMGIFPYPPTWGLGTSTWYMALILLVALLADYHCTKARQVNRLYDIKYRYKVKPNQITFATFFSGTTTLVAIYALMMLAF